MFKQRLLNVRENLAAVVIYGVNYVHNKILHMSFLLQAHGLQTLSDRLIFLSIRRLPCFDMSSSKPFDGRNTSSVEIAFHDFQRGFTTFAIVVRIFWLRFSSFTYFLGSFCISHRQPYPLAQIAWKMFTRADWLIFWQLAQRRISGVSWGRHSEF